MISQRNPGVADMVVRTMEGELPFPPGRQSSTVPVSTVKASGRDRRGQNSRKARGHLRGPQESQESGNTAGSIGRLPFLTRTSGRQPCCQSVPPRPELTFGHTQVSSTLALPWLSLQQLESMSFPRTCSRVLLLERLQLPLPVDEAVCSGCHAPLDPLGRHRATSPRTGRVKKRASSVS